jgi:hypothetical protein
VFTSTVPERSLHGKGRYFPTTLAFLELGSYHDLLRDAAPVAEAFLDPVDGITLSADADFVELPNGIRRTPAEAYFQMWLLSSSGELHMRQLDESGTDRTLMDVYTTMDGQRWLLELGPPDG